MPQLRINIIKVLSLDHEGIVILSYQSANNTLVGENGPTGRFLNVKRTSFTISILILSLCLLFIANIVLAARFDPLFSITSVRGRCSIKTPDSSRLLDVIEAQAYPFGSKIATDTNSSLLIVLSNNNQCRVLDNALLTVEKDKKVRNRRIIQLDAGKLDVELEDNFSTSGNSLYVEGVTVICEAIGNKPRFLIEASEEEELKVVLVTCKDGQLRAFGSGFYITMSRGDVLSATGSYDKRFVRLKNVKGDFSITIKNANGEEETRKTKPGSVVKVWRKKSEAANTLIVRLLMISPEGNLDEAITYSEKIRDWDILTPEHQPVSKPFPVEKNVDLPDNIALPAWLDRI